MADKNFFRGKIIKIFTDKKDIIDIGGGLQIDKSKGNRENESNFWLKPYVEKVNYRILDKLSDYHPDIVGDIHSLPFIDNSIDALICIAVLEHVENPILVCAEMYRVLKPGGYLFAYMPFIYYYHPLKNYYQDFYRFTIDGVKYLFKDFSDLETEKVRGPMETINNLLPARMSRKTAFIPKFLDRLIKKDSNLVSGYNIFCIK